MKKILFILLSIISISAYSQPTGRLPYYMLKQTYAGDTTNYYFSVDSFKILTNQLFFIFNKQIKAPIFLEGNTDTSATKRYVRLLLSSSGYNFTSWLSDVSSLSSNINITTNDNDFSVGCDSVINTTNQFGSGIGINFDEGGSVSMGVASNGTRLAYMSYDNGSNVTSLIVKKDSIVAQGRLFSSGTTSSNPKWLTTRNYVDSLNVATFTSKIDTAIFSGGSDAITSTSFDTSYTYTFEASGYYEVMLIQSLDYSMAVVPDNDYLLVNLLINNNNYMYSRGLLTGTGSYSGIYTLSFYVRKTFSVNDTIKIVTNLTSDLSSGDVKLTSDGNSFLIIRQLR